VAANPTKNIEAVLRAPGAETENLLPVLLGGFTPPGEFRENFPDLQSGNE
jgi:hypothetical protein